MIKRYYIYFVLLTTISWVIMNSSFSQSDSSQDTQKFSVTRNKQLSNSNLVFGLTPSTSDAWMSGRQRQYNVFLKMLLWNYFSNMDDWHNDRLDMSGLQKLEWDIKTNKTTYQPGEPIGISVSLRNISSEGLKVSRGDFYPGFFLNSMYLARIHGDKKQEVYLTQVGSQQYSSVSYRGKHKAGRNDLKPGEARNVKQPFTTLNLYYDLSEPGEYELTFYTRNFLGEGDEQIGEYPKPCTIRFTIEDKKNWLDDHVEWPAADEAPATPDALSTLSE